VPKEKSSSILRTIRHMFTLEIVDGKPVFKEGSVIQIDLDLNMGGNG